MFWFWFFAGPAIVLAILAFRGERKRARFVAELLAPGQDTEAPPATVIVALHGPEEGLRDNLAVLASLDYPSYELIVVARTAADIPSGVLPPRVIVVLGGKDEKASPRVQSLMAGVRASRKRSEILAFADAGGRVSRNWLRSLAAPLARQGVAVSTGYRWYVPEPPDFWSLMRSVWNAPIAGLLGPGNNPFAWCGSMAVRKETLFELRIPDAWRGAVSDDGALTRAVHKARGILAFSPGAMAAYLGRVSAREFFRQARRQMTLVRLSLPRLWWGALATHVFYCGGMAAAVTASVRGSRSAEWVLVVQLGLGMLKGVNRATLAKAELPGREAWFQRHAWVHSLWVPLATWIWLCVLLSSAFPRTVDRRARQDDPPRAPGARA